MSEPEIPQTPAEKRKATWAAKKAAAEATPAQQIAAVGRELQALHVEQQQQGPIRVVSPLERLASLPIERIGFIESVATGGVQFDSSGFQCIPQGAQTVPRDGTAEILPQGVLLSISKPGSGQGKQMFVPWSNVKFIMFVKVE